MDLLLAIPVAGLVVLRQAQFQNVEAAELYYSKKGKKPANQTPAERASKRQKKSHAEGEELDAISQSSEEDPYCFNRYVMGANEDDDDLEQEGSVITGGIGAQQLEEMKKDPFLRF